MKTFFESLVIAFSMYSRIPMPQVQWDEKKMRYSLAFFPLVGAIVGGLLYLLTLLFQALRADAVFFAAIAAALPVAVTGGIHLDGYCDACDALGSHREREEKLRIMKDPHVGAFGMIYTAVLLLVQFGAWSGIFKNPALILCAALLFVVSRGLGGLAVLLLPQARENGLAAIFSGAAAKGAAAALMVLTAAVCGLMIFFGGLSGGVMVTASLLWFLAFYFTAKRQFGGITGDLAGFFITLCETLGLILAALLPLCMRVMI
jgi:adenosylcobinamide-GDP ribazoletransferase